MIFLVEDDPHKALLRFLEIPRKDILHMGSKGNVIKGLKDRPGATGMVDEDPGYAPPHELANYPEVPTTEGLRLLTRKGSGRQRLVVLCPRVEDWLIQRARICGVDPKRHHLPSTPKELRDIPHYEQKDGFRRFLDELKDRDRGMSLLRRWVL
jgi:hypothetical protein